MAIQFTNDVLDYSALIQKMRTYKKTDIEYNIILEKIIANLQLLIYSIINKNFQKLAIDNNMRNDLISEGNKGLLVSIGRFNPNKNIKLNTYAYRRIVGQMKDYLRNIDPYSRTTLTRMKNYGNFISNYQKDNNGLIPSIEEICIGLNITPDIIKAILQDIKNRPLITNKTSHKIIDIDDGDDTYVSHDLKKGYYNDAHSYYIENNQLIIMKNIILTNAKDLSCIERNILDLHYVFKLSLKEISKIIQNKKVSKIKNEAVLKLSLLCT